MKGIILAGGLGTRLYPASRVTSKHLLAIYDKPMIYYPITSLMLGGIREILIITTPHEQAQYQSLLGNGQQWGMQFHYAIQSQPAGIAEAFLIAEDYIADDPVCLMLGDNFFYGHAFHQLLPSVLAEVNGASIFAYRVRDPERYGVVEFNQQGQASRIIEKPTTKSSPFAVVGLYAYSPDVVDVAKSIKPSARGELEISDINQHYLTEKRCHVHTLGRRTTWLDAGTHDTLLDASNFVRIIEKRQGLKLGCPEEAAWRLGLISSEQLENLAHRELKHDYQQSMLDLIKAEALAESC